MPVIMWLAIVTSLAPGAVDSDYAPNWSAPFIREWRGAMSIGEARLLPYAGVSFKPERRHIGAAQLDALEARLLPVLAARLKSVGSKDPPSSYFRQYVAARSGNSRVILVHGYLRDTGHGTDWTRKLEHSGDGRVHFWDAVYIVRRRRFVELKQEGDPSPHVVMIQRMQ